MQAIPILCISQTGVNQATSGTSATVAIPNTSGGFRPRYIRVTSTADAYFRLGVSAGVVAVAGDTLLKAVEPGLILATMGCTHIAVIQSAAAGLVNIVPLED